MKILTFMLAPDTLQETIMTLITDESCRKMHFKYSGTVEGLEHFFFVFGSDICGSSPGGSSDCYVSNIFTH